MRRAAVALMCGLAGALALAPAPALASGPRWTVTSVSKPTSFAPGDASGEDVYRVEVTNTGDAASDGSPVVISDELPTGLELAPGASGEDQLARYKGGQPKAKFTCVFESCTFTGAVIPDDTLIVTFPVRVLAGSEQTVTNTVRVAGGGASDAAVQTPTAISSTPASFGVSPGGASTGLSSDQAGAHPDITTSIAFDTVNYKGSLAGLPKDIVTEEPPGFAGDLVDTPTCLPAQLIRSACPIGTQVGVTTVTLLGLSDTTPHVESYPVYNLSPNPGEVAKFGFSIINNFDIQGNVAVRPGDYGLKVSFHNTNESLVQLDAVSLTVWGVPAAEIHDAWRWKPEKEVDHGYFGTKSEVLPAPYFTNPTSCEDGPFAATFLVNSWEEPERLVRVEMPFGPIVGCDRLILPATFLAEPTTEDADAPTGLDIDLGVKQTYENAEGLATSTLNKAVVTLPEGMTVNPSAGSGLTACSISEYAQAGLEEAEGKGCPNESKLGTVMIETPSLKERGEGSVYLAEPAPNGEAGKNPFDSLLVIYVVARFPERGVLVKVAGKVSAGERTGGLVASFGEQPALARLPNGEPQPGLGGLPPVPFTTFTFKFHQGTTSPLVTPPLCGSYAAIVTLSPWSEPAASLVPDLRPFSITHGFDGGPCPSGTPPFAPQVIAGTQNNVAAAYSPMHIVVVRNDGEQEVTRFSSVLPPGLTANLSGVPFCPDADIELARRKTGAEEQANPSCPAASEIGRTLAGAGVGSVLAWAPGRVYMAGAYNGAPFSIVAITTAKVGPFDLGTVVVREALRIDPNTADVAVDGSASDPIPHIIKGIVVHVRDIRVYIDRPSFVLNPTSCAHFTFAVAVDGAGTDPSNPAKRVHVTVTDPFQAADCQSLKFKLSFKASTSGKTSRAKGASLNVRLAYPKAPQGTEANIRSVKVDLPKQLPSRLTTLQKACPDSTFDANPASCPAASRVGTAKAITPILPVPLVGPAYFVSHGGVRFPELIVVLQGYGVTIHLHGETFISKKGITSSTFRAVPDQPVSTFELTLPQGPDSALAANGSLCGITRTVAVRKRVTFRVKGRLVHVIRKIKRKTSRRLEMGTVFTAQNGLTIHRSTPIGVVGCAMQHRAGKARKATHS